MAVNAHKTVLILHSYTLFVQVEVRFSNKNLRK